MDQTQAKLSSLISQAGPYIATGRILEGFVSISSELYAKNQELERLLKHKIEPAEIRPGQGPDQAPQNHPDN